MMICSRPRCLLVKKYLLGNTQKHKLNFLLITTMEKYNFIMSSNKPMIVDTKLSGVSLLCLLLLSE